MTPSSCGWRSWLLWHSSESQTWWQPSSPSQPPSLMMSYDSLPTSKSRAIRIPMISSTSSEDFRPLLNSTSIQNSTPTSYLLDLTDDPISTPLTSQTLSYHPQLLTQILLSPSSGVGKGLTKPALMASSSLRSDPSQRLHLLTVS